MGIHGLFKELGPGQRISLAKLSADHYTTHSRPLRLAIDISIWLFQIQSGKGGSNPALRTFYYRLLRLLTLNIHPLFVFDGPNKPEWKRGKKVGGPGVRVASVPEFLAKQLLKQFGFPWHVAPGEAEAECALLQREDVVDAVLSEDVDTLMFGSGVTLKNWSPEGSTKTPTHVNVYREEETREKSGLDREGMVLVALMSGGDYIPTGIAGCGPKLASDAARAGFGKSLCKLKKRDVEGLRQWKENLMHEVRTNASKHFSRKNTSFSIPEDFPNWEVLGYYTHPCVSSAEKIRQMKQSVRWDQEIDFAALRDFTADAFDWRCIGGAKKFMKNLAPAILVRNLRLQSQQPEAPTQAAQEERELGIVHAVHGKRNHFSADGELEYRISFTPATFVPIDLSLEEEDDQFTPAGGAGIDSDAESDFMTIPSSTPAPDETASEPASPSKKRNYKPYNPDQPEKLWLLRSFLQLGCPLLVETYEAPAQDPREFLKARRKARTAGKGSNNIHGATKATKGKKTKTAGVQENALTQYTRVTKAKDDERGALQELSQGANGKTSTQHRKNTTEQDVDDVVAAFKVPSTQLPPTLKDPGDALSSTQPPPRPTSTKANSSRPFAPYTISSTQPAPTSKPDPLQHTPRKSKKRRSPDLSSPAMSQRTITSYYSPSPRKMKTNWVAETIDLLSSSPAQPAVEPERPQTPSPENTRFKFSRTSLAQAGAGSDEELELPPTVTKRRRRRPLKRARTAPVTTGTGHHDDDHGGDDDDDDDEVLLPTPTSDLEGGFVRQDVVEITSSSPMKDVLHGAKGYHSDEDELPSPNFLLGAPSRLAGGFLMEEDLTPKASRQQRGSSRRLAIEDPLPQLDGTVENDSAKKVDHWLHEVDGLPAASQSSLPSPPADDTVPVPSSELVQSNPEPTSKPKPSSSTATKNPSQPSRRSPRQKQQQSKKKVILARQSLAGAWKEVPADAAEVEALDLTGDGSGWKASGGKAKMVGERTRERGWRRSGVEVLDLTGA